MPRVKTVHAKPRTNIRVAKARAKQRINQRGPYKGLKPKTSMHHGTPQRLRKGSALKPKKSSNKGVFASHSKSHASSFAVSGRGSKGHVYSFPHKAGGRWKSEAGKHFVDSQYTKRSVKPKTVTQVRRTQSGQIRRGHSWNHSSGSLPRHTSSQQHRNLTRVSSQRKGPRPHLPRKGRRR